MAGDPIYDTTYTTIHWDDTTATDYAEPTTTTGYFTYTIVRSSSEIQEAIQKKVKELIRKASIQKMKDDWIKKPRFMKPMPIMRPTRRLQNICFGGRGWA
jgi:hypothetical protein